MATFTSQGLCPNSGPPSSAEKRGDETTPKPPEKARRRNRVIHSCLECRRRKMKCDRADPCQNCRASGHHCVFVNANTDAQFRQRLTEAKEARDAIESTLHEDGNDHQLHTEKDGPRRKRSRQPDDPLSNSSDTSGDEGYLEPTPLAVQDAAYAEEADDDVEDLGFKIGRMRLGERIGGLYRPRMADEILQSLQNSPRAAQSALPSPPTKTEGLSNSEASPGIPSLNLIFEHVSRDEDLIQYIPSRQVADKLLEQYWSAVHPVARIVHRPSFAQRYETLWEAIENRHRLSPSLAAMVCSVLFSAVITMSDMQVLQICQIPRQRLTSDLKAGVESALSQAQLLKTTKIETLQAVVAYLLPMCIDQISRAHSALTGMAIRLAECMGLHRDPTEYGFSPAECQARRLVWYQLCYLDLKTSEIRGPRPFIHRDGYTTQLPLDVTASRSSQGNHQPTWNEMIFSVIRFECQEMQRHCLALRNKVDQRRISLTKAISKIEAFRIEMGAKYGPYLNTASPSSMQRLSSLVMKLFINLLYLILLHRYMNSVTYRIPDRLRQIVLAKGTEALEAAMELESAEDLQQWAWFLASYQNYHTAFLLLFEVFTFPLRREASRIWQCLGWIFADVLTNIPPLDQGKPVTIQDVVAHRDMKPRYILTLISERMRTYQRAKGLKLPVQFKDSMIVITPQKDGDDSDPRMPLNYAHGEPQRPSETHHAAANNSLAENPGQNAGMIQKSTLSEYSGPGCIEAFSHALDNTGNAWASSSGRFSPWVQYEHSEFASENSTMLHSRYLHGFVASVVANESSFGSQLGNATQADDNIDPRMLEIDWNLWDTIFPPQVNDGNLNIPDDGVWIASNGAGRSF